jgi:hypothetical protein
VPQGVPWGLDVPGTHGVHVAPAAEVAPLGPKVPTSHCVPMHSHAPLKLEYVPLGHVRHFDVKLSAWPLAL